MRIQLPESERAELRQLQHSLVGTSDYVYVTCGIDLHTETGVRTVEGNLKK